MLSTLITSKTRRTLLTLFLTHPDERFYQEKLIRDLKLPSTRLRDELAKLEKIGFVTSSRPSNTRYYQVNKAFPLYSELKSIVFKTVGLADFLKESLEQIGHVEVALVYGSVAKDVEDLRSDVDVLVIGEVDFDALHDALDRAEQAIGREINPTIFARDEWRDRVERKQAFALDVLSGSKIFLIGGDDELRRLT